MPLPSSRWDGRPPWALAKLTAEGLAVIERSLRQDSSIPTGQLLPVPDGLGDPAKNGVRNALIKGKGAITPVETTAGGFGQGRLAAPRDDYVQRRFGPAIPETSLGMRDSTILAILHAYGVSPKVLDGDGNAMRESRRALYLDTILPLAAVVSQELSEKLGSNISLDFNPSQYRDFQRLSRSLKTFIDAGLSLGQASSLLGINLSEGTPPALGAGRQAGAVVELANGYCNQDGNPIDTPLDTPLDTPTGTPTNTPSGLRVRHLKDSLVVGRTTTVGVVQRHFPALPESCLVAVLTRPSGSALWG